MITKCVLCLVLLSTGAALAADFKNLGFDAIQDRIDREQLKKGQRLKGKEAADGWDGTALTRDIVLDQQSPGVGISRVHANPVWEKGDPYDRGRAALILSPWCKNVYCEMEFHQTGQIPPTAKFLKYYNAGGQFDVSINGKVLPGIVEVVASDDSIGAPKIVQIDISQFSGKEVEIRFTTRPDGVSTDYLIDGIVLLRERKR